MLVHNIGYKKLKYMSSFNLKTKLPFSLLKQVSQLSANLPCWRFSFGDNDDDVDEGLTYRTLFIPYSESEFIR